MEDTWEEADDAVIVGGEGEEDNWADMSDNDLSLRIFILAPLSLFNTTGFCDFSRFAKLPVPLKLE